MNDKRDNLGRNALDRHIADDKRRELISRLRMCGVMVTDQSLLDVDVTRSLKARAFDAIKRLQARRASTNIPLHKSKNLFERLHALGGRLIRFEVVLFNSNDESLGGLFCDASAVLQNAETVWGIVEHDLIIVTDDVSHGLCIEKNYYAVSGEYVPSGIIEITSWGRLAIDQGQPM